MTTAQREAISSPAEGLMVYDTTVGGVYVYRNGSWGSTDEPRDNYKLVNSVADLSDELTAGGGTTYELNENTFYEINGTVIFDYPIDLNGAYLSGLDSGEDILVNGQAGSTALFIGDSGSMRYLTLSGNGKPLFNMDGSALSDSTLIMSNSIIAGASSLGTITGFDIVFFDVTNYVSNSDGYNFNNIRSLYITLQFWGDSNAGTFLDLTGGFDNIQMSQGRIVVDSGEIGLDVSSNPTVTNNATLSELSFVGAGTYVDGYTTNSYPGYNFTTDWIVRCPGIPQEADDTANANFYFDGTLTTGFSQSIIDGTAIEIQDPGNNYAETERYRFRREGSGNRLVYEGEKEREFSIVANLSVRVTGAATNFYAFLIAVNGVVQDQSNVVALIASDTQVQNVTVTDIQRLQTGDYVEVFAQSLTGSGTDSLVIFSQNVSIQ
jgi:hypothetical protein